MVVVGIRTTRGRTWCVWLLLAHRLFISTSGQFFLTLFIVHTVLTCLVPCMMILPCRICRIYSCWIVMCIWHHTVVLRINAVPMLLLWICVRILLFFGSSDISRLKVCGAVIIFLVCSRTSIPLLVASTFLISMVLWIYWSVLPSSNKIPVAAVSETSGFLLSFSVVFI